MLNAWGPLIIHRLTLLRNNHLKLKLYKDLATRHTRYCSMDPCH
jgi:hypothetical protein